MSGEKFYQSAAAEDEWTKGPQAIEADGRMAEDQAGEEYIGDEDVAEVMALKDEGNEAEPMTDDDNDDQLDGGEQFEADTIAGEAATDVEEDMEEANVVDTSVQGFFGHKEPVYALDIHPHEQHVVASGGGDDKMYLWRSDTGDTLHEFAGHTDSVIGVRFSADGQFVASGGMDGKTYVYWSTTGERAAELEGPNEVTWIDWHPHGNILLAGASDATVWMWEVPTGNCRVFAGHAGPVTAGRFTPDGKKIVTVSEDDSFILWDPKTAKPLLRVSGEDARFHTAITCVAVNRESTLALTGSEDGTVRLINLHSGVILAALDNHAETVEDAAFCDTLPLVAVAGVNGQVSIWDVQKFTLRTVLTGHAHSVTHLTWHRDSALLTTCSADGTLRTWDARSGVCLSKQGGHFGAVLSLSVTTDGRRAVSGGDDGICLVFDLQ